MANRIVQPKVKNADGTYDNLIMQEAVNATNATNSIKEADNTYSALEKSSTGLLTNGNIIIPTYTLLWSGNLTWTSGNYKGITLAETLHAGDILEIFYSFDNTTPISQKIIVKSADNEVFFLNGYTYVREYDGYYLFGGNMCWINLNGNIFSFGQGAYTQIKTFASADQTVKSNSADARSVTMYKIYKVIM